MKLAKLTSLVLVAAAIAAGVVTLRGQQRPPNRESLNTVLSRPSGPFGGPGLRPPLAKCGSARRVLNTTRT